MWCADPSCMNIIKDVWGANCDADVVSNYMTKAEPCTKALQRWNVDYFGHVRTRTRQLEAELRNQWDATKHLDILICIREWRRREAVMWWQ